ncbi:MAG: electron transfer flavoprotein alpha subunit, partial [Paraglaciecola sp.]
MAILLYAEHDNVQLKSETHKLVNAALQMGDELHLLVAGENCKG